MTTHQIHEKGENAPIRPGEDENDAERLTEQERIDRYQQLCPDQVCVVAECEVDLQPPEIILITQPWKELWQLPAIDCGATGSVVGQRWLGKMVKAESLIARDAASSIKRFKFGDSKIYKSMGR